MVTERNTISLLGQKFTSFPYLKKNLLNYACTDSSYPYFM